MGLSKKRKKKKVIVYGSLEIGNSALPFSYFQVSSFWCVKTHYVCLSLSHRSQFTHQTKLTNTNKKHHFLWLEPLTWKWSKWTCINAYPSLTIQMNVLPTLIHILFYSEKKKKKRVNKCATIYNDIFGIFHQENDGKDRIFLPKWWWGYVHFISIIWSILLMD